MVSAVLRDPEQVDRIQWKGRGRWRQGNQPVGASKGMIVSKSLPYAVFRVSMQREQELSALADIVLGKTCDCPRKLVRAMMSKRTNHLQPISSVR
jgi:hypothetical protein